MRKTAGWWTLAALIMAVGCADHAGRGVKGKEPALRERVDMYHELITLRDYDAASLLIKREYRNDFVSYAQRMQRGYTLESYSIVKVEMNPAGNQAAVVVSRSFVAPASVTLQTQDFVMHWELGPDGGWMIASPPY
ncbi:MAG TPA: hypothetical protein VM658_00170 [bacterium]|nr:hypothetical protein [bacterium]